MTDAYFDASSLSDGSLRFIALATLLLQPESLRPSVILLDEPELGLHPYVITMLASLLKQAAAQRAAPFFDDFALAPQQLNEDKIRLEWRHKGTDAYFDASSLSDGSLRFIALATLLLQPESLRPSVILLDEPELGLHPYVITMLASLLKQAAAQTQIILATQSPFLLDHFEPEDVLVADRVNGQTQLTRLDTPSLETWLQDYSLGQLWEKNEIGGRPSPEEATAIWQQNLAGKKGRGRDCVRAESKDC